MAILNFELALNVFNKNVALQKQRAYSDANVIEMIDKKVIHTREVVNDGNKVVDKLGFNESFRVLAQIAFLNHDIGRFMQARLTKSFEDIKLAEMGLTDHGHLGKLILQSGVINEEIPDTRTFDSVITDVVNNHVNMLVNEQDLAILNDGILKNDVEQFYLYADQIVKNQFTNALTQIVQDVDRLDIYHQILDGRWIPSSSDDKVNTLVFKKFYKGDYLNINELKTLGVWNSNVGDLVRLSFIDDIKLYSVAKMIVEERILERLKEIRNNPNLLDAFDYAREKLDDRMRKSDGIVLTKRK